MVVFDKNEEQIVATLKGHTKKVTSVIYHPSQVTFSLFHTLTIIRFFSSETILWLHSLENELFRHILRLSRYFYSPVALFFPTPTPLLSVFF